MMVDLGQKLKMGTRKRAKTFRLQHQLPIDRSQNNPLILVADNDLAIRTVLRQVMEAEGYQVVEASNGEECLQVALHYHPDLVLLDATIAIIDGFTCCQRLSALNEPRVNIKNYKETLNSSFFDLAPTVIITSLNDAELVERAFAAGATECITKPINMALLRQRVQSLLQAKREKIALKFQEKQTQLLATIGQQISQSRNLMPILNNTVAQVQQLLLTDRVLIYQFEPDWSGKIVVEAAREGYLAVLDTEMSDSCFPKEYVALYQQGRVRVMPDIEVAEISSCHRSLLSRFEVKANLALPILQGEELWGLLIAHQCSAPRHWQTWEIDFLQQIAVQMAIAVQQSHLYQQVQQSNTDSTNKLQERIKQLQQVIEFEEKLKSITNKVRDSLDEGQILQTTVEELILALSIGGGHIALYDKQEQVATDCHEDDVNFLPTYRYFPDLADEPEISYQLQQRQHFQFCVLSPVATYGHSFLVCPISDEQGILGDLWLFNQVDYGFEELEINLVKQVANQCAIALRQSHLYEATQTRLAQLEQQTQLKDDFLSTVTHEMRSPLANMRMAIEMVEQTLMRIKVKFGQLVNLDADYARGDKYLQILRFEYEREINLINNLLDLKRLEAGQHLLNLSTISLRDWIVQRVEPFQKRSQERNIALKTELPTDLPDLVSDSAFLERIFTELLNNACKYTPPSETITVTAAVVGVDRLQLQVSNSGVEIPTKEFSRIFDKFYRIPKSDHWKQGGTGLGLALVKELLTNLGGSIHLESANNLTCFTVALPLKGFNISSGEC
ncbi:MAG: GAF domain-containing protein [Mojavia pulchra JT2-VF2]|jgi:signal transduction histidine kinase/CheY-like chemotaxis protein|uniref:histidine kinase n=1 Tax=Mojavia pulchra JT2-VF2 TaxID=287848 RepID=A0A951Q0M7_9NOST|nr:GAF domain-containing protein [Mojavia pulchra JT2-VF2]